VEPAQPQWLSDELALLFQRASDALGLRQSTVVYLVRRRRRTKSDLLERSVNPYWTDGQATVYLGDCLDVLPTLDAVDHVITDPPYARDVYMRLGGSSVSEQASVTSSQRGKPLNHQYSSPSIEKLAAGAIGHIDEMLPHVAAEIARMIGRWAIVFSDVESCHLWRTQLELAGCRYIRTGAWVKTDPMPQFTGDRPAQGMEVCTIAHAQGSMRWNGGGMPALWRHGTAKGADRPNHPCPKPLPLMTELVSLFTDPGDLILDPFMGSGTTLVAAKQLGRRAIGIELEEKWAEAAVKRLEATTPPLFVVPSEKPTQSEMEVTA